MASSTAQPRSAEPGPPPNRGLRGGEPVGHHQCPRCSPGRRASARTVLLLSAVVGDRRVTITETIPDRTHLAGELAVPPDEVGRLLRGHGPSGARCRHQLRRAGRRLRADTDGRAGARSRRSSPGTLLMAARGELRRYLPMPIPWVLAEDVADIALLALERGRPGRRYLAMGRPEDTCSLPQFCNTFLEMAGIDHRVEEFDPTGPGAHH